MKCPIPDIRMFRANRLRVPSVAAAGVRPMAVARAPCGERAARIERCLAPFACAFDVDADGGGSVLRAAAALAASTDAALDAAAVLRALARREQAASTALGAGIAIPHARVDGLERARTLFLRTRLAVEFGATDGKPVDRFLVILVPRDGDPDDHLEMLAKLTQRIGDAAFRNDLGAAHDALDVRRAFAAARGR